MGRCLILSGIVLLIILFLLPAYPSYPIVAFPGAEGFGATAIGGRGGRVLKVTNLNSSGAGSLQAACEAEGPRIVVFEVAGVIRGDLKIRHPYITIAGQTAPSPGITIEGRLLSRPEPSRRIHDIIVRFIRIRPPTTKGHDGDCVQLPNTERVILDHLSLSWANDEIIDICHSSEVTVQWCTIEESDMGGHDKGVAHNFGLISAYPHSGNISIHHNLFAHHSRRSPSLSPYVPGKPGDFRNNVVYNFRDGFTHDGHVPRASINIVNNYYKRGPNSFVIRPFEFQESGKYYVRGNYIHGFEEIGDPRHVDTILPFWVRVINKGLILEVPARVAPVRTHTAIEAFQVVTEQAGCFPRDVVTRRTIQELFEGTGKWGRNAEAHLSDKWYMAGLVHENIPMDSDGDGIPDYWEEIHGLNKYDSSDAQIIMTSGYTAIETYINDRADLMLKKAFQSKN